MKKASKKELDKLVKEIFEYDMFSINVLLLRINLMIYFLLLKKDKSKEIKKEKK